VRLRPVVPRRDLRAANPTRSRATNIDVGKGATWSIRMIESNAANQIRIVALYALDGRENNSHISERYSAVAIQIVHATVAVIVDNHVRRIAELMTAVSG